MKPIIEGGDVVQQLGDRVLGRVTAVDVKNNKDEVVIPARTLLDEEWVAKLENLGVDEIIVRSGISCDTRKGVCVQCYGRDLGRGHLVNLGEAVGVVAAQSIGEPGTQLTMRTFHIGGAASRSAADNNIVVKNTGAAHLSNVKTVVNKDGNLVTVSRSGVISVLDEQGREKERYKLPYGAVVTIKDNDSIQAGQEVATWDPHTHPIVTEVAGTVDFVDFVDGSTINTNIDDMTGFSSTVVTDPAARGAGAKDLNPMIRLLDDKGDTLFFENTEIPVQYPLAGGAVVGLTNGCKSTGW